MSALRNGTRQSQSDERGKTAMRSNIVTSPLGLLRWATLAAALLVGLGACDKILEIDTPTQVSTETLNDPEKAVLLVNSAIADFECAFVGYIVGAGLNGDELANANGQAIIWDLDRRSSSAANGVYGTFNCATGQGGGIYTPLSTARFQGDHAVQLLEGWTDAEVPNRARLIATASAYAGYSTLLLGESMCSTAIDLGPELNRDQAWQAAVTRFTKAITTAQAVGASGAEFLNMALVGRARTRLNLKDVPGALADALLVPAGFVKNATYNDTPVRRYNHLFNQINNAGNTVVEDDFRNLTVAGGVPDRRVPTADLGRLTVGTVQRPWWIQTKYKSLTDPIPIARYAEAQLVVAEARGGQEAVTIVNALRAAYQLPPYTGGTSPADIRSLIVQERSRELFLESQHLGDKLRYNLPFTPAAGTPFPYVGGVYGDVTCFPLPLRERQNNPNID